MKTQNIIPVILGLFLCVSCSKQFTLQKRHYRKGLYFSSHHQPEQKHINMMRNQNLNRSLTDSANYNMPGKNSGLSILAQLNANQMPWFDSTQNTSKNLTNEHTLTENVKIKKSFTRNSLKSLLFDKTSFNKNKAKSFYSILKQIIGFLFIAVGLFIIIVGILLLLFGGPLFDTTGLILLISIGLVLCIGGMQILW